MDDSSILTGTPSTGTAMLDVRNGSSLNGSFGVLARVTDPSSTSGSAGVRGLGLGAAPGVWGSQSGGSGVYGNAVGGLRCPRNLLERNRRVRKPYRVDRRPGEGYGVYGSGNIGVFGTGTLISVQGSTTLGTGVKGESATGFGVSGNSSSNDGIHGQSSSGAGVAGTTSSGNGVYGDTAAASGNYAGYFVGNVGVTGAVTGAVPTVRIDHPLDPAHRYLQHVSVASPDMLDLYNGNVTTDAHGFATVRLPRWFQTLNRTYRYQLTILGHAPWGTEARVWDEIAHNRFTIRTNRPRVAFRGR